MSKYRKERIGDLLRDEMGQILHQELDLEIGTLATVTRVVVSEDLQHAKVYVSIFPSSLAEEVWKEIQKQVYYFQQILNKRLRMRPIPKIYFVLDRTEEEASKVEKLIEEGKK